ncbi:MAG TPA: hypothetical protein VEU30_12525 [Thermoanaerobaculia bacterium]|nr:hypothetical protein [Thermoanaerobaculia bacterium]
MRARFLKAAELEVEEAAAYFDAQRTGLGDRFEKDLENAVTFLMAHPRSGRTITDRIRKFSLRTSGTTSFTPSMATRSSLSPLHITDGVPGTGKHA